MIPEELEYVLDVVECPIMCQSFIDDWKSLSDEEKEKVISVISLGPWKDAVYKRRQSQLGLDGD